MRSCFRFTVTLFGLSLAALGGCADFEPQSYPAAMTYPLRADPILTQTPATEPKTTDRPGELHQILNLYLDAGERNKVWEPAGLDANQRAALSNGLTKTFGTPAQPTVHGIEEEAAKTLQLQPAVLAKGSQVYRQHCLHCHGLTGDGRGPTAAWVNPHPRDFRRGVFKFTSSALGLGERQAHRDDLLRVLREGIEDASMPSFRLLGDAELEAVVSYVIHLSLRGQVEHDLLKMVSRDKSFDIAQNFEDFLTSLVGRWVKNQDPKTQIHPGPYSPPTLESVQRGMKQFLAKGEEAKPGAQASAAAGCASCHVDFGRAGTYRFDDWGTIIRPTDLTRGLYRGGRRPIDLYWRIHAGVNGAGMPAFAKDKPDSKDGLSTQDIWDVVHFLQVLPYPEKHREFGVNIDTTVATSKGR